MPNERFDESAGAFIDRLSAVALVLAVLAAGVSVVQNVFLWAFFPTPEPGRFPAEAVNAAHAFKLKALAFLLFALLALVAALGLRRRREWGRRLFVGVLGLAALGCIGVPLLNGMSMSEMTQGRGGTYEPEGAFLWVATIVFAMIPAALLLWLARYLMSSRIRGVFTEK